MVKIFISYRRADSNDESHRIYKALADRFGEENIFRDKDRIPRGVDFRMTIEQYAIESDEMLVLIGQSWLDIREDIIPQMRRLDNPDDFVRIEVEMGLRHAEHVTPVILQNATMPNELELPRRLVQLSFQNATFIRPATFENDLIMLLDEIATRHDIRPKRRRLPYVLGLLILLIVVLGFLRPIINGIVFPPIPTDQSTQISTPNSIIETEIETLTQQIETTSTTELIVSPTPDLILVTAMVPVTSNDGWTPYVREFDGVEMMLVPVGSFQMGSMEELDEQPIHEIQFDVPFWIDRYEVSNAQFLGFGGNAERESYFTNPELPRENLTLFEASDFCELRGARLPTESEWEYVARGPDGLVYPWGNAFSREAVNYCDTNCPYEDYIDELGDDGYRNTASVIAFPVGQSWVGAANLSGNVWEWVSSIYMTYPYRANHERVETISQAGIIRGGSWGDFANSLRGSFRNDSYPTNANPRIGFRCVRDLIIEITTPIPATSTPIPTIVATDTPVATATSTPEIVFTSTPSRPISEVLDDLSADIEANSDWTPYTRDFNNSEIQLVPSGCFQMGNDNGSSDEQPVHDLCLEPYWIDKYETTTTEFVEFLNERGNQSAEGIDYFEREFLFESNIRYNNGIWEASINYENHPINYVSWYAARDYCDWRDGRLPTEAEWEFAGRGPDGLIYPWGNTFLIGNGAYSSNSPVGGSPVGNYQGGMSWVGALDMSGNMREWVSSLFLGYPFEAQREDLSNTVIYRVVRGGVWHISDSRLRLSYRFRSSSSDYLADVGFRCARDFNPDELEN